MSTYFPAAGTAPARRTPSRLRAALGLAALVEVAVFTLVAVELGLGVTILLALATSALGMLLLARQGTRTLAELRDRAVLQQPSGRALGDAGLVALGGLLMVLPGFVGDLLGLLCLLPVTRPLPRALIARGLLRHLPDRMRGPVRVRATRAGTVGPAGPRAGTPTQVIEGEIAS